MANEQNLKPFTGADDPRRANGPPKGTKHISTWIQEMLNDEEFELWMQHPTKGYETFKGAPLKAIIKTAAIKAANNDAPAREWLAKYGYGSKVEVDIADNRKGILEKYMGGSDVGKTEEAESRPPTDPA